MRRALLLSFFFPLLFSFTTGCAYSRELAQEKTPAKTSKEKPQQAIQKEEKTESELTPEQKLLVENLLTPEETKPSIWPVVGIVSSKFGWRRMGRYTYFHAGIDIATDFGTPVVASAPGKVIYAGYKRGYGYIVVVYHGYGYTTVYAHLSEIKVKRGDLVDRGKVIGFVGATGRATGPHLHYEVLKYGLRQDPMIYLP